MSNKKEQIKSSESTLARAIVDVYQAAETKEELLVEVLRTIHEDYYLIHCHSGEDAFIDECEKYDEEETFGSITNEVVKEINYRRAAVGKKPLNHDNIDLYEDEAIEKAKKQANAARRLFIQDVHETIEHWTQEADDTEEAAEMTAFEVLRMLDGDYTDTPEYFVIPYKGSGKANPHLDISGELSVNLREYRKNAKKPL